MCAHARGGLEAPVPAAAGALPQGFARNEDADGVSRLRWPALPGVPWRAEYVASGVRIESRGNAEMCGAWRGTPGMSGMHMPCAVHALYEVRARCQRASSSERAD